ncbi:MAG: putative peptidoglycan binding domain protein [Syntrophorhabdus sp. PtaU1.Bin153]|nr:MAG: putative peptidoglycan binding domain protein [Syntrophorhabdus sp. PtaU1.Bin153]
MEKFKTIVTLISAAIIPLVVAFLGNSYTQALKEREVQAQFVKIAVDILQSQPSEYNRNVREWATQIINRYSGIPLSTEARRDLIEKVPISATTFGQKYAGGLSADDISTAQQDLRTLGFYKGPITGIADEETVKAIMEFQRSVKIRADGALGLRTKGMLQERAAQAAERR